MTNRTVQTTEGPAQITADDDAYIAYLDDHCDDLPGGHSFGLLLFKGDPGAFRMGREEWKAEQNEGDDSDA